MSIDVGNESVLQSGAKERVLTSGLAPRLSGRESGPLMMMDMLPAGAAHTPHADKLDDQIA